MRRQQREINADFVIIILTLQYSHLSIHVVSLLLCTCIVLNDFSLSLFLHAYKTIATVYQEKKEKEKKDAHHRSLKTDRRHSFGGILTLRA